MKFFVQKKKRFKLLGGIFLTVCVVFVAIFLFHPASANSQCIYNFDNYSSPSDGSFYGACTFTQSPTGDNCPPLSAPSTEGINEFYAYGASGVSVLYCSGSTDGAGTAAAGGGTSAGQSLPITMQCAPPTGATIQAAYLDVVTYDGSDVDPSPCLTAMDLNGAATPAGVLAGTGNLWNEWIDPRYGLQSAGYPYQTLINVRYNITGLVSLNTTVYTLTDPNPCTNYSIWGASLVIVYTVPAPGICGAVALDDGLFYFDDGDGNVREGVTPFAPTVDWSCVDPTTSCGTNQFSIFGGSQEGFDIDVDVGVDTQMETVPFTDNFYGTNAPVSASAPVSAPAATEWLNTAIDNQPIAFDQTYNGVPTSGNNQEITWGLGYANIAYKQEYWVSMLAGGCNAACAVPSPTNTFTNTATNTITNTATITPTNTPTATPTNTNTNTVTNTPTNTPTATPTNTPTNTPTYTDTNTVTNTVTNTPTVTDTNTPTNTATLTDTNTVTDTPTNTTVNTPTNTPTVTDTDTPTNTATNTIIDTPTNTPTVTDTPTDTIVDTLTNTPTATDTNTPTNTATDTVINTATNTPTNTPTNTATDTAVNTYTYTNTATNTPSNTSTDTPINTNTYTNTATNTPTNTSTNTPINTNTFTNTMTNTPTNTFSSTPTYTASQTPTNTFTPSPTVVSNVTMAKNVSETTANPGDLITYSIGVTVTGGSAMNVVVTDTLAANLTFVSYGNTAPAGTTVNPNPPPLKWTLPSPLAVGTYQLTYQTRVSGVVSGETITNGAQLIDTGLSAPLTASVNVQVTGEYTVDVNIYNSAGEIVKTIHVKNVSQPINNITLSATNQITSLQGPGSTIEIFYDGILIGTWDGSNNSGNPVTNGNYEIQVDSVSPLGVVTSVRQQATVNRELSNITADIYNSAGELIRTLYYMVGDATSSQMTDVGLSAAVINLGGPATGNRTDLQIFVNTTGTPVTLTWDGTNNAATNVTPGTYEIELHWYNGTGETTNITRSVVVTGGGTNGVVAAEPNVLEPGQTMTTMFTGTGIAGAWTLNAKVYTIAGELVKSMTGSPGTATAFWNASGMASGIYIVGVQVQDVNGGILENQLLKVLVLH